MKVQHKQVAVSQRMQQWSLEDVCRRWHLSELSFFGSVLRPDFSPTSDVDVIVDFEPGYTPGFAFTRLVAELESVFGRPVDVLTRRGLEADSSPAAQRIKQTAVRVYESGR